MIYYFPEYEDNPEYVPPKQFMWDIFWTLNEEMANKFINHSLKQRSKWEENEDRTVEVAEDVLNQLHSTNYFSKKKGKALYMLKTCKEFGVVQRKRKRVYDSYDPNNQEEEKKETQMKRAKVNEGNSKITEWLVLQKKKNNKKDIWDENEDEANDSSGSSMNVDKNIQRIPNPFRK